MENEPIVLVKEESGPTGYLVRIETPDHLAQIDVAGRPFGQFTLAGHPRERHCTHSLDDVVGYVVFDNSVKPNSVTRRDRLVLVGRSRYGDAVEEAGQGESIFSRGIGQLCKCGWRSY